MKDIILPISVLMALVSLLALSVNGCTNEELHIAERLVNEASAVCQERGGVPMVSSDWKTGHPQITDCKFKEEK